MALSNATSILSAMLSLFLCGICFKLLTVWISHVIVVAVAVVALLHTSHRKEADSRLQYYLLFSSFAEEKAGQGQAVEKEMALLEMIGLGGDKQAVILDIGEAYTKIGFAGESTPRHIIPSRVRRLVGSELVETKVVKYDANEDELFDILREFLHSIYFRYLLVNPKERKVVISESLLAPVKFRNTLAKVLFKYFDVVSVMFAPCHLFALFTLGVSSALVVDCGYSETLVVPIYEHTPILAAVESFQIAGHAIHGTLREELLQSTGHDLKEDVIENIKVTSCFIGSYGKPSECVPPPIEYPIGDGTMIKIDGKIRANSFNAMFDGDEEEKSVATTILSAIAR